MKENLLAVVCCALLGALSAGAFELEESRGLQVGWNGTPFVVGDFLGEPDELTAADGWEVSEIPGGKAVNVYRSSSDWLDYRREMAVSGDMAELAVRYRVYAYHEKGIDTLSYGFRVPAERLDGYAFRAVTDRPYRQKVVEGTLSRDMADGDIASGMAFLNLNGADAALTLDFAYGGHGMVYNLRNYGAVGNGWTLAKAGEHFEFRVTLSVRWYGGLLTSKVIFLDGAHDYEALHPVPDERHYGIGPRMTLGAAFYEPAPEGFTTLGLDPFGPGAPVGWLDPDGLSLAPAVLGRMVTGQTGTLRCETDPGFYLVTVRFGAEGPIGPFSLTANGGQVAAELEAEAGAVASKTFGVRLPDGRLDLTFEGQDHFGVSAVLLQQFLSLHEEMFCLRRALWQVPDVPTPDKDVDPGEPPAGEAVPVAQDADWRWTMAMACLGPSNTGSCNELNTYADIERRIQELEASGHNTIICNGLHFRLCHLSKRPMIKRNMKLICDVAHRHGFRVIEHHDVPLMLAHGEGYQTLLDHIDWLQRDIVTGRVCTYFCPNNPGFQQWYYDWFEDYARATGIDGSMLDEVTFFERSYCGCPYCRAKFKRETGQDLPCVDDGSIFFDKTNPLWVTWEKFRIRSTTDFFKGIRDIFDRVNPQASMLTYTTHYGFTSDYGSRRFGGDIVDRARYLDFLGTEIMSRNVFDCYRAVNAYRKTKNALMYHFNAPVYGLVYHLNDPHMAYFGWALHHMNRQVTWIATIEGEDMTRYIRWQDKMDVKNARALAEIAVVFSRTCCNYNRSTNHKSDVLGCCEMLSDAHLQYDVILDLDLAAQTLARYRLVVLPSVECLSAGQVGALEEYVRSGGGLLVTCASSQCDENGTILDAPALSDLAGIRLSESWIRKTIRIRVGDAPAFEAAASARKATASEDTTVLAHLIDADGNPIAPALTQRAVGGGQCFYTPMAIGAINYEPELTIDKTYDFTLNAPARDLFLDIVRRAVDAPLTFEPVRVPERVLVTAYRVPGGYAVHFLNATGVQLKPGDIIPRAKTGDVFPAMPHELVFDLRVPQFTAGRVVSPDYAGERPVRIETHDGAYRITVASDALHAYAIVYLK